MKELIAIAVLILVNVVVSYLYGSGDIFLHFLIIPSLIIVLGIGLIGLSIRWAKVVGSILVILASIFHVIISFVVIGEVSPH